jgi:hypothetical protein
MTIEPVTLPFPFGCAPPRTQGIHVYDIIASIMKDIGEKQYKSDDQGRITMEMGFLWERALEHAWGEQLGVRVGEIVVDGIIGSPDGLLVGSETVLQEYKCTWMSSNKAPEENFKWLLQTKAYCFMLECVKCQLHILHVNGDYRPPRAQYKVWNIEYSPQELIDNWKVLVDHAKQKGMLT